MVSAEEEKAINEQISAVKGTIKSIRDELDVLNKEKESWMAKKNSYKQEILGILGSVRELKDERNTFTSQVKLSKKEREEVEKRLPELQKELAELYDKRSALSKKLGVRGDVMAVKRDIEKLQQKVETMPMSFSAEKKIMATINQKKKQLAGANEIFEVSREIKTRKKELDQLRGLRSQSHSKVQEFAKTSQKKHEGMIEESQKIDELRKQEEEAFNKFKEFKAQFKEKSQQLSEELQKLQEHQKKLGIVDVEKKRRVENAQKKSLAQKVKEVQEKMKSGGKLTNEDLLVLQTTASDDDE